MATKSTTAASVAETKYSKAEILFFPSLTGAQRDILGISLSGTKKYTYSEALKEAEKFKSGGLF